MMIYKITSTVDYNYLFVESLYTQLNKPTNQNSIKVSKVFESTKTGEIIRAMSHLSLMQGTLMKSRVSLQAKICPLAYNTLTFLKAWRIYPVHNLALPIVW